jgi:methylisocitrate lyase
MASDLGFQGTYLSGAALTASRGVPDIGLLSLEAFTQAIEDIYHSSGLPIIADADTGFGEGEMCAKTVWQYNKAGAAGLHMEDQQFPKRCGHLDGKSLIPMDDMVRKIQISAQTRDECSNGDFIICARTDARGVEGIESTVKRSIAYINAGADMIFPEGLENLEEFEYVAKQLRAHKSDVYLLANMTEFGKTPLINFNEFERIGYSCVIYPVSTLRVAMGAV